MNKNKKLPAEELDRKFDAGEDISPHLDWNKTRRPGREQLSKMLRETRQRLWDEVQRLDRAIEQIDKS